MMFEVRDSGQAGEECEQSTAHLYEGLDQPVVPRAHSPLQVDDAEPHAVGGEGGMPRHKAQPHVMQPLSQLSHTGRGVDLAHAGVVYHVQGGVPGATGHLSQGNIRVTHSKKMRPQAADGVLGGVGKQLVHHGAKDKDTHSVVKLPAQPH